jgi:hypothetical protein
MNNIHLFYVFKFIFAKILLSCHAIEEPIESCGEIVFHLKWMTKIKLVVKTIGEFNHVATW